MKICAVVFLWVGLGYSSLDYARDVCNCKGYDGPGGPCYSGPGGPAYAGPGGPAYAVQVGLVMLVLEVLATRDPGALGKTARRFVNRFCTGFDRPHSLLRLMTHSLGLAKAGS